MFLKVLLKGSLSLRISKIHLLKHFFPPWTKCFHAMKPHSSRTLSSYFIYKFCHLLSCFSKEKLSHAIIWRDVLVIWHSKVALAANILKPNFGGFDSSFFLQEHFFILSLFNLQNGNLQKCKLMEERIYKPESKSTADIHLPHSSMCFHQKIVMDSQAISSQRLLL